MVAIIHDDHVLSFCLSRNTEKRPKRHEDDDPVYSKKLTGSNRHFLTPTIHFHRNRRSRGRPASHSASAISARHSPGLADVVLEISFPKRLAGSRVGHGNWVNHISWMRAIRSASARRATRLIIAIKRID